MTMITPSYLGETIEYSSLHACRSTLEDPTNGLKVGNRSHRAGHFLGVRLPGGVPSNLTVELAKQNVFVSVRGDSVRITPHLYNNSDDVDRLFEFLAPHL